MNPEIIPDPGAASSQIVGYCRACGKALDEAAVRNSHGTIYCAEHVPQMPATPPPINMQQAPSGAYVPPQPNPYQYATAAPPPIPNSPYSGTAPPQTPDSN